MKTIVRILIKTILILLTVMMIVGCSNKSSDRDNLTANYVNNSNASGDIMVDTGQVVCFEGSDGRVTCICYR